MNEFVFIAAAALLQVKEREIQERVPLKYNWIWFMKSDWERPLRNRYLGDRVVWWREQGLLRVTWVKFWWASVSASEVALELMAWKVMGRITCVLYVIGKCHLCYYFRESVFCVCQILIEHLFCVSLCWGVSGNQHLAQGPMNVLRHKESSNPWPQCTLI